MHDADAMAVVQRAAELHKGRVNLGLRERALHLESAAHRVGECAAAAERKDDGDAGGRLDGTVKRAHVRMAKLPMDRNLLADPLQLFRPKGALEDDLGRHRSAGGSKACGPHPAGDTLAQELLGHLEAHR